MKKIDVVIDRLLSISAIMAIVAFVLLVIAGLYSFVQDVFQPTNEPVKDIYQELSLDSQKQIIMLQSSIDSFDEKLTSLENEIDILKEDIKALTQNDSEDQTKPTDTNFVELRDISTNMFYAMDYRKITNTLSDQYKIQQHCVNNEYGIRMYSKYYTVALGSYFTRELGDTYHVTLENGYEFDIMLGDFKNDAHTFDCGNYGNSCVNYDGEPCVNVIEFIMDDLVVPDYVMNAGTFSILEEFGGLNGDGGNIKSMEYTGRVDLSDILT